MTIQLNGSLKTISAATSLLSLIEECTGSPIPTGVAVAINYSVIPQHKWASTPLEDGDEIEILWASSGG